MRKNVLLVILCCLFSISFAGNVVPVQEAKTVCKNYLNTVQKTQSFELSDFTLQHTEYDENGEAVYYRFSIAGKGFVIVSATEAMVPVLAYSTESDFVAHEGVNFVLDSYKKNIINAKQSALDPETVAEWNLFKSTAFKGVTTETFLAKEHEPIVTSKWNQSKYFNFLCPADAGATASQHPDFDYDDHVPVGCVAVNMASIMYYYRYPESGISGVSYRPGVYEYDEDMNQIPVRIYPRQTADFANTIYNYDVMNDKTANYNGEVAKLLWHNGISVLMGYGPDGSYAYSINALESMKHYWKYSENAGYASKSDISGNQAAGWANLVMGEIDSMRPIYYSASASDGGHAFLFDGYKAYNTITTVTTPTNYVNDTTITSRELSDTTITIDTVITYVPTEEGTTDTVITFDTNMVVWDTVIIDTTIILVALDTITTVDTSLYNQDGNIEVHVNWGWGGASNGYFILNGANRLNGYTDYEAMFTGLVPSEDITKPVSDTTRIVATAGTLCDGAGNQKYQPNTDRTWIISAPEATSYTFTFSKLKTEANADIISFYDAANPSTPLRTCSGVYAFADTALPTVTINADSVLVRFVANANDVTDYGFLANFTAIVPEAYCQSSDVISDGAGVISDKGANYQDFEANVPYRPESFCKWTINPANLSRIYFSVTKFELGLGDVVDIFDIYHSTQHPELLARFDMYNFPSEGVYAFDARRVKVQFVSDNYDENNGFEMTYENVCGVNENSTLNVAVYPNPATSNLYVELNDEFQGKTTFKVFDMTGKMVSCESVDSFGGQYMINVSNLAKGMYMLNVENANGKAMSKFVVE